MYNFSRRYGHQRKIEGPEDPAKDGLMICRRILRKKTEPERGNGIWKRGTSKKYKVRE